jgi:tRNA-binding protein
MKQITWQDFEQVELRIGTIIKVEDFIKAKKPAYIITADFGEEFGVKKTSSQITDLYTKEELVGKQIVGVVNFPPKQIGPIMSQFLCAGLYHKDGGVVLVVPDKPIQNGVKVL